MICTKYVAFSSTCRAYLQQHRLLSTIFRPSPYLQQHNNRDFLPGISSHEEHERVRKSNRQRPKEKTSKELPPPPPSTPPPLDDNINSNSNNNNNTSPTTNINSNSHSLASYPGEEESMPDFDETDFQDADYEAITHNATASGTIRAYYLSRQIDVLKIFQKLYGRTESTNSPTAQVPIINKNSVILVVPTYSTNNSNNNNNNNIVTSNGGLPDPNSIDSPSVGYAVFLDFGAAIFFGLDDTAEAKCLASAEEFLVDRVTG